MPAKSEAQRRFIYAKKGAAWAKKHHFDNPGKLPARVGKKKSKKKRSRPKTKKRKTTTRKKKARRSRRKRY